MPMASKRLDDLSRTFILNKETVLRALDNSKGQLTASPEDVKLMLLGILSLTEIQGAMIQELNDLLITERKKTFFQRLFNK